MLLWYVLVFHELSISSVVSTWTLSSCSFSGASLLATRLVEC